MSKQVASIDGPLESGFAEIAQLINSARQTTLQTVNTQMIQLYWQVGAYISDKIEKAEWGEGVVTQLATYLARSQPGKSDTSGVTNSSRCTQRVQRRLYVGVSGFTG